MTLWQIIVYLLIFSGIFAFLWWVPKLPLFARQVLTIVFGVVLVAIFLKGTGLMGILNTPVSVK